MKKHFDDFDFTNFWDDDEYSFENYIEEYPSDELIASIEQELGYKLPASYIELMKLHNGGMPNNTCFPTRERTTWSPDHIAITGIYGIGRNKKYSLCGELGGKFMLVNWEYPPIGICICDCPSAGHDMIMLDYSKCGKDGEPEVVHVDQELDYEVTFLAKDFETFIRGLVNESVYDTTEADLKKDLEKIEHGKFSTVLTGLCNNFTQLPSIGKVVRNISKEITTKKGHFSLHADELSYLLYDIQFWLYSNTRTVNNQTQFINDYSTIIALPLDGEFTTNGYAPSFIDDWFADRLHNKFIVMEMFKFNLTEEYKQKLLDQIKLYASR